MSTREFSTPRSSIPRINTACSTLVNIIHQLEIHERTYQDQTLASPQDKLLERAEVILDDNPNIIYRKPSCLLVSKLSPLELAKKLSSKYSDDFDSSYLFDLESDDASSTSRFHQRGYSYLEAIITHILMQNKCK